MRSDLLDLFELAGDALKQKPHSHSGVPTAAVGA